MFRMLQNLHKTSSSKTALKEITTPAECDAVTSRDLTVLFKHSSSCGTSWMAHREVGRFLSLRPETSLFLVSVGEHRSLSRYIAERFDVEHESPQILVVSQNRLLATRSHDDITLEFLLQVVDKPNKK